ncbi:protein DCL, chloroplastic-like [Salvia splendens]|uniref:protein DCL, chloroplastic-like n=1 Tax=Salvia splendens TaxID=180675 RepID=UPI001C2531BD|nr:protein DCL, chloroplastic-like [Salvia splendens]
MASLIASSSSATNTTHSFHGNPISQNLILSSFSISFPLHKARLHAVKTRADGGGDLLRKPVAPEYSDDDESENKGGDGDTWVDWEDQILEDTVPLVGFVRMILHSGKYECGDRLSPEHERTILERVLPYHPAYEDKIGSGVDYITIGYHPTFGSSRCLFIVRKDGELVDFSYWKCIKGLIRKNYPLYADSFILRHFRKSRRND